MSTVDRLVVMLVAFFLSSAHAVDVESLTIRSAMKADVPEQSGAAEVRAYLAKPAGAGPFGAVVALHGCGGLSERFKQEMTDRYTSWGYVVLVVDSFSNHEVKFSCGANRARSRADDRPLDAIAAVQHLARLPYVDPRRIALIGSSQGSWVALELAQARVKPLAPDFKVRPSAIVAYYPDCRSAFSVFDVPTLILVGELDNWTPASRCQDMVERRGGRGAAVDLVVYPEARHGFDWVDLQPARVVAGYLMEYHERAARDSMERHREFLRKYIGTPN